MTHEILVLHIAVQAPDGGKAPVATAFISEPEPAFHAGMP
jgi:hypothetical protein